MNYQIEWKCFQKNNMAPTICLAQKNHTKNNKNQKRLYNFAWTRNQPIYIFTISHKNILKADITRNNNLNSIFNTYIRILLKREKTNTKYKGLFIFSQNIPVILLNNIYMLQGLVNGIIGIIV